MTALPKGNYTDANPLANVTVMGLQTGPRSVTFNKQAVRAGSWTYDPSARLLRVTGLDSSFTPKGAWSQIWALEWT